MTTNPPAEFISVLDWTCPVSGHFAPGCFLMGVVGLLLFIFEFGKLSSFISSLPSRRFEILFASTIVSFDVDRKFNYSRSCSSWASISCYIFNRHDITCFLSEIDGTSRMHFFTRASTWKFESAILSDIGLRENDLLASAQRRSIGLYSDEYEALNTRRMLRARANAFICCEWCIHRLSRKTYFIFRENHYFTWVNNLFSYS